MTAPSCRADTTIQTNELPIVPPAHTSAPTQPTADIAQARRLSVYARLGPHPMTSEPVLDDTRAERRSVHTRLGPLPQANAPVPAEVRCTVGCLLVSAMLCTMCLMVQA